MACSDSLSDRGSALKSPSDRLDFPGRHALDVHLGKRRHPTGCSTTAGILGTAATGYIVGSYDKNASPDNQRLYLNGRVAQMSDTQPIDLNSAPLWHRTACERHRRFVQRSHR
jgi:hypothetical protein